MKSEYVCQECGKTYTSYKENSKFCSVECRRKHNSSSVNCNYCGKEFVVYKSVIDKLKTGEYKSLYCSKDCQCKSQIKDRIGIQCGYCGDYFYVTDSASNQKYCSRLCFEKSRSNFVKLDRKICPVCSKEFTTYRHSQIYCSEGCRDSNFRNGKICRCDNCGKEIYRKQSDFNRNKTNFCSIGCKNAYFSWNESDIDILEKTYGKADISTIQGSLSRNVSIKGIQSKAIVLGLTKPREWHDEEIDLLTKLYSTAPMSEVLLKIPGRTPEAIITKAHLLGLVSYHYLNSIYTQDEILFLKDNYLTMSDNDLASTLHRTERGISQRLRILNLFRPNDRKNLCYKSINEYVRGQLYTWKQKALLDAGYKCSLSGLRGSLVVHHCRGFNVLLSEAIDATGFEIKEDINDYSDDELKRLTSSFLYLQDLYGEYVVILESIHKLFHKEYGYGNNTMEQWNEFCDRYLNNKLTA